MKDDEKFFSQFQEAPRTAFAAALHKRINRPMNAQRKLSNPRRTALSFAAVFVLLIAALFLYPPTRAQAFAWLRQIGAFTITTEEPAPNLPTAIPPDPAKKPLTAETAKEASELAGFNVLAPQNLPAGYEADGPLSITQNGKGKTAASGFTNRARDTFILINQYRYQPGDSFTNNVTGQETVRDVMVRGRQGVLITGRMISGSVVGQAGANQMRPSDWLVWEENGIVYSIASDDLGLEELQEVAESLR